MLRGECIAASAISFIFKQRTEIMVKTFETEIADLIIIEPQVFEDSRGHFFETYKFSQFFAKGISDKIVQINQSFSNQNVVRGLHFQANPHGQAKLVKCLEGEIYDVAVDLRKSSPTFGKYFGINLSSENKKMLYIPVGFAHGFSVISSTAKVEYAVFGGEYAPQSEGGIKFDDADLKINWQVENPIVSDKDRVLPALKDLKQLF